MVTRRLVRAALITAIPFALIHACDKVPLLAPTGSVITLLPTATTASLNSSVNIIATVIKNGVASASTGTGAGSGVTTTTNAGNGTPVQNGTVVSFTTTIGTIQPAEASTVNGQVTVQLRTGTASGTATITAYSGGASTTTTLKVGTAAAAHVALAAVNQALGSGGGSTQILAQVTDDGGNPIGGVPVTFSTDQGSITPSITTTDASGNATATLSTTATATITAAAGTQTATVKVNVGLRGLSSFTVSPTSASTGIPVTFTVTPTANANVSNVIVNFGDGASQQIGAISSAATISHTYSAPGNYTATATSTDATGANSSLSTSVTIGSLAVGLTASPSPGTANAPITFTVTGLTTAQIDHVQYTYDDGTTHASTSTTDTHVFAQRGIHTARVDVIGIGGGQIGTASTQVDVQ